LRRAEIQKFRFLSSDLLDFSVSSVSPWFKTAT
jgi:hypothetical protein